MAEPLSTRYIFQGLNEMVNSMLTNAGLPSGQLENLDSHSTIAIEVKGLPEVMLSALDERLWLWCLLPHVTEHQLINYAQTVLPIMTKPISGVEGGQLTLGMGENGYELKALINLDILQHKDSLSPIFQSFVTQLRLLCQALKIEKI
ncbi:hypothetical protein M9194_21505 [Vibrio sp. S4M6]|uniref:InvB/SpaK family type III secretion system chaperone n=1 Tax=Vibrio sinus TaxID=2946865 RepID=UPI00202A43E5|nr:hypothetical protein [Vibrio sinus]MCL9783999.1 hypothetical protein [Vibrio sinus]